MEMSTVPSVTKGHEFLHIQTICCFYPYCAFSDLYIWDSTNSCVVLVTISELFRNSCNALVAFLIVSSLSIDTTIQDMPDANVKIL